MRCKSCEYPLWQIRDRLCPECGAPFRPSDFEFVLNSVRFCCPHCNQAYYGTGPQGHLVPREFDCVSCAKHISMDEMVLLPTEGVREEQTNVDVNPWLERKRTGLIRGWFATVIQSMGTPGRLIRATPPQSSLLQATWYAAATNGLYLLGGMSLLVLLFLIIGIVSTFGGGAGVGGGGMAGIMGPIAVFIGWAIGMVVAMIIGAFIWGLMAHGLLLMTGPTAGGIGRTMQCMLYSSGTNVANAVPCLGFYIGWISSIWWTISATIMLKEGQKVSGGRASLAAILPVVGGFCLLIGLFVFAIVMPTQAAVVRAQAAAATAQAQAGQSGSTDATRIAQLATAIRTHANEYGTPPAHGVELIDTQRVWVSAFLKPDLNQMTRLNDVRVAGMTLSDLGRANGETTDAVIAAANASLGEGVIAHRLGDSVFCYHGIDFAAADPGLWVVVSCREPGVGTREDITVGFADGTTSAIADAQFDSALAEQNELRSEAGLPALPDPRAIASDKPATKK